MTSKPAYRQYVGVWLALMALLALTCGSAFIHLGAWNTVANFAIAALKAVLVGVFFMHLGSGKPVYRVVVLGAVFVLSLVLGLSLLDYSTRSLKPSAWQVPTGAISKVR